MWLFYSAIKSAFELERVCRWCGKKQVVTLMKRNKDISCCKCGKRIRPKL